MQPGRRQPPGPWLQAYLRQGFRGFSGLVEKNLAEAADILIDKLQAAVQMENEVDVRESWAGVGLEEQSPGHAQVDQQIQTPVQVHQEIFTPAAQARNRVAD